MVSSLGATQYVSLIPCGAVFQFLWYGALVEYVSIPVNGALPRSVSIVCVGVLSSNVSISLDGAL